MAASAPIGCSSSHFDTAAPMEAGHFRIGFQFYTHLAETLGLQSYM